MHQSWVRPVAEAVQRFARELTSAEEPADLRSAVADLLIEIGRPPDGSDNVILSALLVRAATEVVEQFHRPSDTLCECSRFRPDDLRGFLNAPDADARVGFSDWFERFWHTFERHHIPCIACRAARAMLQAPTTTYRIPTLARIVGTTPLRLARRFRRHFGVTLRDYEQVVRLRCAVGLLTDTADKIEVVAFAAGYQSKKTFYHALHKWLHVKPRRMRAEPRAEQQRFIDRLDAILFRPCASACRNRHEAPH